MSKKINCIISVILSALFFTGCSLSVGKGGQEPFKETVFAMDTYVTQLIYRDEGEVVADKAFERVAELEDMFSLYIDNSDISKINANAGKQSVKVNEETIDALERTLHISNISGGAYDITIGPIVLLWDISNSTKVPSNDAIEDTLKLVDYNDVVINDDEVMLNNKDQLLDFGSIGKGVACDEVVEIYNDAGVSGVASIGGTIGVVGTKDDGSLFKIGVRDPRGDANSRIGILSLKDTCVSTSGDYERYFISDDVRYHHIFDSATGYPSDSGLISSTVVTKSATDSDILSTATFVLGLDKSLELLKNNNAEGILIDEDKNVYVTSGLNGLFKFEGEQMGYKLIQLES